MNVTTCKIKNGTIFAAIAGIFAILSLSSCAKKMVFSSSPIVPAATGFAKITKDKNENYHIEVEVRNLAPADKLSPPRSTYIVWAETVSNGVKNIGKINTDSGLFSKQLKASLNANIAFEPKYIFITAEDIQNSQYPGTMIVLTTQ
jgi:hypothetical protein